MRRNGVWGGNCEIQTFSEIYSVNVNIHELESTLEPSYKFINAGASDHPISLMYRRSLQLFKFKRFSDCDKTF